MSAPRAAKCTRGSRFTSLHRLDAVSRGEGMTPERGSVVGRAGGPFTAAGSRDKELLDIARFDCRPRLRRFYFRGQIVSSFRVACNEVCREITKSSRYVHLPPQSSDAPWRHLSAPARVKTQEPSYAHTRQSNNTAHRSLGLPGPDGCGDRQ